MGDYKQVETSKISMKGLISPIFIFIVVSHLYIHILIYYKLIFKYIISILITILFKYIMCSSDGHNFATVSTSHGLFMAPYEGDPPPNIFVLRPSGISCLDLFLCKDPQVFSLHICKKNG
jgi:hypothetical protein